MDNILIFLPIILILLSIPLLVKVGMYFIGFIIATLNYSAKWNEHEANIIIEMAKTDKMSAIHKVVYLRVAEVLVSLTGNV